MYLTEKEEIPLVTETTHPIRLGFSHKRIQSDFLWGNQNDNT